MSTDLKDKKGSDGFCASTPSVREIEADWEDPRLDDWVIRAFPACLPVSQESAVDVPQAEHGFLQPGPPSYFEVCAARSRISPIPSQGPNFLVYWDVFNHPEDPTSNSELERPWRAQAIVGHSPKWDEISTESPEALITEAARIPGASALLSSINEISADDEDLIPAPNTIAEAFRIAKLLNPLHLFVAPSGRVNLEWGDSSYKAVLSVRAGRPTLFAYASDEASGSTKFEAFDWPQVNGVRTKLQSLAT